MMNRIKNFLLILFACACIISYGQDIQVYPTNWFTGMQWNKVQLIVRSAQEGFNKAKPGVQYPGVQLAGTHQLENSKYQVLDLVIAANAKPGMVNIHFGEGSNQHTIQWPLKHRREGRGKTFAQGVTSKDFIYLIMPDRFSNGDTRNDRFADMRDTSCDRNQLLMRHGGDIQGVTQHLDYIKDLGITTVWMTPVVENDMPLEKEPIGMLSGFHGYWFTDQYKIDKRFGGEAAYLQLSDALHAKGMKLIQDAVYNHMGIKHWIAMDPPAKDWINQWPSYTGSNHRDEAIFDAYGNAKDKKQMLDGWFTPHLPDVNQRNPYVANFLIQHAIWSTETFGVDGWRVDTYKYCDEAFLNRINDALLKEYPSLTVFGEVWANTITGSAYFARNNIQVPFKHNLQGVTDFPVNFAIQAALNQSFGWTEGVNKLYMTLAQDILYKDPLRNCIFLDNHDVDRFYSVAGEDMNRYKQGITLLLTLRGIPQLYYGTEILMKNLKNPGDAMVRFDFPGGFPGDKENKFETAGRTAKENEAHGFVRTLAHFRKNSSALTIGKTVQYLPFANGVYVYFRYDARQTVMCIINTSDKEASIDFARFEERTKGFSKGKDILDGQIHGSQFSIPAKGTRVLELQP
jgi:glycosidase